MRKQAIGDDAIDLSLLLLLLLIPGLLNLWTRNLFLTYTTKRHRRRGLWGRAFSMNNSQYLLTLIVTFIDCKEFKQSEDRLVATSTRDHVTSWSWILALMSHTWVSDTDIICVLIKSGWFMCTCICRGRLISICCVLIIVKPGLIPLVELVSIFFGVVGYVQMLAKIFAQNPV